MAAASGPDVWPYMRGPQLALWLLVPVCLILDVYGGWCVFLALLCALLRKFGMVKVSKAELRKYMFLQDF